MGCDYSTRTRNEPEDRIQHHEAKSQFCAVRPAQLEYVAIKYASGPSLSELQIKKVWEKLGLDLGPLTRQGLLTEYKRGEGWDRNGLFTAAVLLSAGSIEEKCVTLFWLFVPGGGEYMDKSQGKRLCSAMMSAAVGAGPRLVPEEYKKTEAFEKYMAELKRKEASAAAQLYSLLLSNTSVLTVDSLTAVFHCHTRLLTLHGLRRYAEDCPQMTPRLLRQFSEPPKQIKKLRFAEDLQEQPAQSSTGETRQKPILKRTLTIA